MCQDVFKSLSLKPTKKPDIPGHFFFPGILHTVFQDSSLGFGRRACTWSHLKTNHPFLALNFLFCGFIMWFGYYYQRNRSSRIQSQSYAMTKRLRHSGLSHYQWGGGGVRAMLSVRKTLFKISFSHRVNIPDYILFF